MESLNPIDQFDPVVIVAVMVIFLLTFTLLRRVFVLPYLRVMEERERLFEEGDAHLADAQSVLDGAGSETEHQSTIAHEEADEIMKAAAEKAEAYRKQRVEGATRTATERLERGRSEIAEARANEFEQLRQQAVDCVGLACDQLFGETDPRATEAVVDDLMARRVH